MTDFSNVSKLALSPERTAKFPLYQLEGEPTLIVVSATDANKPYYNKLLQRSPGSARKFRALGVSAGLIEENREADRELYAKYVLRGWERVQDVGGKDVAFSTQEGEQFLAALPSWLFDDLRTFCSDPNNFLEKGTKSAGDVQVTAGN